MNEAYESSFFGRICRAYRGRKPRQTSAAFRAKAPGEEGLETGADGGCRKPGYQPAPLARRFAAAFYALMAVLMFLTGLPTVSFAAEDSGRQSPVQAEKTLSLKEAMNSIGGELSWDPLFQSGVITSRRHRAVFQAGAAGSATLLLLDNKTLLKLPSPYTEDGQLRFPETFVASLRSSIEESVQGEASRLSIAAIVVDPGHGGKDPGAIGSLKVNGKSVKVLEKDITLKVSKILFEKLNKAFPGKKLILTRSGDTYPTLEDRVNRAHSIPLKENEAVIFISIHANSSFNKKASGYEVWYLSPDYRRDVIDARKTAGTEEIISIYNDMLEEQFTTESVLMAQSILKQFNEKFGGRLPSRGIKAEEWFVVRKARMPSVLVELGFVSNEKDAELMMDSAGQEQLADAIYRGIFEFVERFEKSGGFTDLANR
ncbi:MAG: N-acetylmuramoyl-L-alanine amidase [Spirochaetaceae bacterium]|jgi:N-acetylmuramoyl-L-alanine amidase|nr:N-acetylmuramoyl-L-alanine amidase [Spirochaetaceae bacterium]